MHSCSYFCTAEAYHIDELARFLRENNWDPKFYGDVIHLRCGEKDPYDVFIFFYGCVCFWGAEHSACEEILELLKPFENKPIPLPLSDRCLYTYGNEIGIDEEKDSVTLDSPDDLVKLSFSYGLTQSVKLQSFENVVEHTIQHTRHIPQELAEQGKISLSGRKISQQIGELFIIRSSITLHNDILDLPEFFWRLPRYEPYYHMSSKYMDISARLDVLNRRLDVIHELYGVLSEELKHQKSIRLELYVVILIIAEVVLSSFHVVMRLFFDHH
jgi:uncharacterized Rmd1/YagE family protein